MMDFILQKLGIEGLSAWAQTLLAATHILVILLLAWSLRYIAARGIRLFKDYMTRKTSDLEELKRVETVGRAFHYLANAVITVVAGMLVLSELGISIAPILATAGVLGIAVGFAAQNLIKNYLNGFFILLENQIRQGDVVEAGGKSGLVEEVTLRYTRLRDYDGNVHFVPNGGIEAVTNKSREFAYAVVDIQVAYRENVDEVMKTMHATAAELRQDQDFAPRILDNLEMAGVDQWAESAVVIKARFRVRPLEQWNVRREYLRRLKHAFDRDGIEIPYPHVTFHPGQPKDSSVLPFQVATEDVKP